MLILLINIAFGKKLLEIHDRKNSNIFDCSTAYCIYIGQIS